MNLWRASPWLLLAAMVVLVAPSPARPHPLERGLLISDPLVLSALEARGWGFSSLIAPQIAQKGSCARQPVVSKEQSPFQHYPLCQVAEILRERVAAAQDETLDDVAKTKDAARYRFPTDFFTDKDATLTLVGVVNRLDRAYRPSRHRHETRATSCGEVRFIYRFGYREEKADQIVESRLPLTLNLVLRARRLGQREDCAAIAKSWLDFGAEQPGEFVSTREAAVAVAERATKAGPLALLDSQHVDRLEVNIQILRLPALVKQDFGTHAEYLLKVFNWDTRRRVFVETPLENQIDPKLGTRFAKLKRELFRDAAIADLDRGELVIRQTYLTTEAISVAPGGESRSQNGPINAYLGSEDECSKPNAPTDKLCLQEITRVLEAYEARRGPLQNVKSAAGFITRLNDVSCSGCHQTRSVAGFHFTGADLPETFSANAVFVPGSPHLFGDLARRAALTRDMASGKRIDQLDFSRGFSARPARGFAAALADTALFDGWGAACDLRAGQPNADKSFADWTCRPGLTCEPYMPGPHNGTRGLCANAKVGFGDMLERGQVRHLAFGNDTYERLRPNMVPAYEKKDTSLDLVNGVPLHKRLGLPGDPTKSRFVAAQQMAFAAKETGGFPGGMLRTECCEDLPGDATCGMVAVNGFNACLADKREPFTTCFQSYVNYAGLRACDAATPCREDYICLRPMLPGRDAKTEIAALKPTNKQYTCRPPDTSWLTRARMGTCIPPYFVLQFRADKHQANADVEAKK